MASLNAHLGNINVTCTMESLGIIPQSFTQQVTGKSEQ